MHPGRSCLIEIGRIVAEGLERSSSMELGRSDAGAGQEKPSGMKRSNPMSLGVISSMVLASSIPVGIGGLERSFPNQALL